MTDKSKKSQSEGAETSGSDDSFDKFSAFFMQPAMDVTGIMDFTRKNMSASVEIGKIYSDGTKDVISRSVNAVKDNMKELVDASQGVSANQTADVGVASGFEFFQGLATKNLALAREMTELMVDMNQKAVAVVQKRVSDGYSELKQSA